MDEILSQKPILKENYYAVLGCDELSTVRLYNANLLYSLLYIRLHYDSVFGLFALSFGDRAAFTDRLAKQSACLALYYRDSKEQYKPKS